MLRIRGTGIVFHKCLLVVVLLRRYPRFYYCQKVDLAAGPVPTLSSDGHAC